MRVDLFDFELPQERIALRPARPRDSARLLLVEGDEISDHQVLDLPDLLRPGDVLVFNDTKVIPAQLEGRRGEAQHRRDPAQARGPARVAGVPAQRQAGAGRRHDRFRRRRARVGRRQVRRRIGAAALPRRRAGRVAARAGGADAAAALHRVEAGRGRRGPRRLPDDVRARGRRGRRADGRAALHAASAGRARCSGDRPRDV